MSRYKIYKISDLPWISRFGGRLVRAEIQINGRDVTVLDHQDGTYSSYVINKGMQGPVVESMNESQTESFLSAIDMATE